jgi:hypothetical protein
VFKQVFLATILFTAGCTLPVKIEQPTASETGPVQTFVVRFDTAFVPGTFNADLSGTNITALFAPTPAPGSVATAAITYFTNPQFMDYGYLNNVTGNGITPNKQLLRVGAKSSSNGSCCDSVTFSPAPISIFRGGGNAITSDPDLSLHERETISATVFVNVVPKEGLTVRVTGHPSVSLNDEPAGQAITLSIPNNDRRVDFEASALRVVLHDQPHPVRMTAGRDCSRLPFSTGPSASSASATAPAPSGCAASGGGGDQAVC